MSDPDRATGLLARLRANRERWIDIAPGKRIKMRRPAEAEFSSFLQTRPDGSRSIVVDLAHVQRHTVGWDGITEADLLGATVGVQDAEPFSADVWAEAVADRLDWLKPAAEGLLAMISDHANVQAQDSGNSAATSTPGPA